MCCRDKWLSTHTALQRIQQFFKCITIMLWELLQAASGPNPEADQPPTEHVSQTVHQEYSDDVFEYADTMSQQQQQQPVRRNASHHYRGAQSLSKWLVSASCHRFDLCGRVYPWLLETQGGHGWGLTTSQSGEGTLLFHLQLLPSNATSVSGMMATTQRTSLYPKNIDMAAFFNATGALLN